MTLKTRDLPLYEYFTKLQEEYVCAELRYKIYPRTRDKCYYKNKVMEGKKKVIDDISWRNGLPSIFNNDNLKHKIYSRIYQESGYPNFIYKDELERRTFEYNDKANYYELGSAVKVKDESDIKIGTLKTVSVIKKSCTVLIEDKECEFKLECVTRIL